MQEGISITLSKEEFKSLILEAITEYNGSPDNSKTEAQQEPFLKIEEVCDLLKVSKVTIHKWKREGRIPYHRISNRIYFLRSEILEALKSSEFNQRKGGKL